MILDRETVIQLLDREVGDYDSNLVAIKLLPSDAMFEIVIEDAITAEYYDEENEEYFRVNLSYDYFSSRTPIKDVETRNLEMSIKASLEEQRESAKRKPVSNITKMYYTSLFLLIAAVASAVYYVYTN